MLDEYKKLSNKALQHTRRLIPQLVGAITTAHCTYEFGHIATAHIEATIYYILKLVKKVADNIPLYLSYARYHASFEMWRNIQSKALKQDFSAEAKAAAAAAVDTVALSTATPRSERWTLTPNEIHQLRAYDVRKPKQKTPKMILLYSSEIVLSEAEAWSLMPYFESWSHFLDYFRYTDPQDVMDWVACLPLLKVPDVSHGARAGNDEDMTASNVSAASHEPAVLIIDSTDGDEVPDTDLDVSNSSGAGDADNANENENENENDDNSTMIKGSDKKSGSSKRSRALGPALVKRIYEYLVPEIECIAKKPRTEKQIAKLNKTRESLRPGPPGTLAPSLPSASSVSSVAAVKPKLKSKPKPKVSLVADVDFAPPALAAPDTTAAADEATIAVDKTSSVTVAPKRIRKLIKPKPTRTATRDTDADEEAAIISD